MIKKNGGIFGRNPTYNDVVVEGTLTMKEAQVFDNDITINGDFTVNGTSTSINTVNLDVDDKNISMGVVTAKVGLVATNDITAGQFTVNLVSTVGLLAGMTATKTAGTGAFGVSAKIASVDSATQITMTVAHATSGSITFDVGGATDDTADGGGITLKGTTDKLITWVKSKLAWVFNQPIETGNIRVDTNTISATNTNGDLNLNANGSGIAYLNGKWGVNQSGTLVPAADNTYDIGNGAVNPRDIEASRNMLSPGFQLKSGGIITESGTTRTLSAADNGKVIYCTSGSAVTINCAAGLGAGFSCTIIQGGAGKVTIAANSQTLVSYSSLYSTMGQYAIVSLICPVANTFYAAGNLGV